MMTLFLALAFCLGAGGCLGVVVVYDTITDQDGQWRRQLKRQIDCEIENYLALQARTGRIARLR